MTAPAAFPTFSELLDFAKAHADTEFETLDQRKPFHVFVKADEFYFRPYGKAERRAQSSRIKGLLAKVYATDSWKPSEYAEDSFNASYLLALIKAWQAGGAPAGTSRAPGSRTLNEAQKEELKGCVRAAIRHRDCAIRDDILVHGFQVHHRHLVKNQWVGSVYWSDNNFGNDVEIAFDLTRLAHPGEVGRLRTWFEMLAKQLQHHEARNHSGDNASWFRTGFSFADAVDFFTRLAKQTNQSTPEHHRWIVDSSSMPQPPVSERDAPPAPIKREDASVTHMLSMARQACDQSGQVRTVAAKVKSFQFADEAEFRRHISELLASQENRCALTRLPLQFIGDCDDEECLASLDRIDSDGHYAPGNVQIVCRFINRWKSDDLDNNFRRLLKLVTGRDHRGLDAPVRPPHSAI